MAVTPVPREVGEAAMTLVVLLVLGLNVAVVEATWCVARSDASYGALQEALDYACSAGADCAPIESSGLCYLPNSIQNHASYAFNSYYQRKANAPSSCNFSGAATIAKTDPSFGSCVYPASPSSAGGGTPLTTTPPSVTAPPPPGTTVPVVYNNGGLAPTVGSAAPNIDHSKACLEFSIATIFFSLWLSCSLLHVSSTLVRRPLKT
ncbi:PLASMODESMATA CALLOSE-BINDING PROTEIN 3-like [Diospyros lotus]|uniref:PLASMODESMATA CALLOSE-BINDING PROTEIN 3-like n=1 Tax=Diospyros lotus TaxID=55363 RepID=UPI00224F44BE|nr:PLASMODESMATA CALLOSE-BINDING PROTEIN 3-like [Diospyros lotus]